MADAVPTHVQTYLNKNDNSSGWMLYKPIAAGMTVEVDQKRDRHWNHAEAKKGSDSKYYTTGELKLLPVIEAVQPIFFHIDTRKRSAAQRGGSVEVAMSLNGLSVVDAWTKLSFFAICQAGTSAFSQGDRPVVSAIRTSKYTLRNTGPFPLEANDIVMYVPPKQYRAERFMNSADDRFIYVPTRKEDQGLFRLMPMPLAKAVDYLLKVDKEQKGAILNPKGKPANKKEALEKVKEAALKMARADTSKSATLTPKEVGRLLEERRKKYGVAIKAANAAAASTSSLSSSSTSSSQSASFGYISPPEGFEDFDEVEVAKMLSVLEDPDLVHPMSETERRKAALKVLSRFFAGRCLLPGKEQANYVLEVHASQFG